MALEPGEGRAAVPVRSALLGSVLAVALVVTTLDVRRQPADAGLQSAALRVELDLHPQPGRVRRRGGPAGRVDDAQARQGRRGVLRRLLQRPRVGRPGGPVPPGERRGRRDATHPHGTRARRGPRGRARRGHHGRSCTSISASTSPSPSVPPPMRLSTSRRRASRIVGTATFPAIGFASTVSDHTSMGTGMLIPFQVLPKVLRCRHRHRARPGPRRAEPGPRPDPAGRPPAAALAGLHRIVAAADRAFAAETGWIRRQCHRRTGGPASGRDRQLQDDRAHPRAPGGRAGAGRRRRPSHSPSSPRSANAVATWRCLKTDRLRPAPAGRGCGLAGDRRRGRRNRGRDPSRDRRRAMALGPLRACRSTPCRTPRCRAVCRHWSRVGTVVLANLVAVVPASSAARTPDGPHALVRVSCRPRRSPSFEATTAWTSSCLRIGSGDLEHNVFSRGLEMAGRDQSRGCGGWVGE